MFEVGKLYEFATLASSEDGLYESSEQWRVAAIEGTLLHLHVPADPNNEFALLAGSGPTPERNMVLNTASAFFHSAKPVTDR